MNPLIPIEWWALFMLVAIAGVLYTSRRLAAPLPPPWRWLSPALRLATLLCMGALLLNPGEHRPLDAHSESLAWVLLDRSGSMSVGPDDAPTRFDTARDLARGLPAATASRVRVLPFADRLEPEIAPDELHTLDPDGEGTDLFRALRAALDRAQADPRPSRGILVLTDGIHNAPAGDAGEIAARALANRVPISAKLIGEPVRRPDLDLRPHQDLLTVTAGAERPVRGVVRSRHLPALRHSLRLVNDRDEVVAETLLELPPDTDTPFVLHTPELEAGLHAFRLEIDPAPGEARLDNNQRDIRVNAIDIRLRVLLLEGTPHWDSKFLAQWLRGRAGVELTTYHRLAENRFFRVDPGQVRPQAGSEPSIPGEAEDFTAYDMVLVGRGLDTMSSPHTAAALHRFARDHGGIVVFTRGRPVTADRPALESLLPVAWMDEWDDERVARPTRAGERSGLFGDLLPGTDSDVWEQLPALRGLRRLRLTDGLAVNLLEATLPGATGDPWPVLVARRYGHGQILLINGEGMWHWDFLPTHDLDDHWYGDFWTQLLLWSTQSARFQPGREWHLTARPTTPVPGQEVEFRLERRQTTADTHPPNQLTLTLEPETGPATEIPVFSDGTGDTWRGRWTPETPGHIQVQAKTDDQTQTEPLLHFRVAPPPGEMDQLDPQPEPLRSLVEASNGTWIEDEPPTQAFPEPQLPTLQPTGEAVWHPHWTKPWLLLAIVALPGIEWAVRRRLGLV